MLIRATSPLRISFAGRGTDVPPFPQREGGCVLNVTVTKYSYGMRRPTQDDQISIKSVDFGLALNYQAGDEPVYDGELDLVKAAIRKLQGQKRRSVELFLRSEAPPGSGLGVSSSLMVTLVGLLKEFQNLPLDETMIASGERPIEILALNEALEELGRLNERQVKVVELRYFVGLTVEETAAMLELSPETVKLDWRFAKAWLQQRLKSV